MAASSLRTSRRFPSIPLGLPCLSIHLGRTKRPRPTTTARPFLSVLFRALDRWGAVEDRALTPQSINPIVKRRCEAADLDPSEFSAPGLRAGYLTEAGRRGVSLPEAMQQSQHRSVQWSALLQRRRPRAGQGGAAGHVGADGRASRWKRISSRSGRRFGAAVRRGAARTSERASSSPSVIDHDDDPTWYDGPS